MKKKCYLMTTIVCCAVVVTFASRNIRAGHDDLLYANLEALSQEEDKDKPHSIVKTIYPCTYTINGVTRNGFFYQCIEDPYSSATMCFSGCFD